jgi:N-ethylmaleimide reductase
MSLFKPMTLGGITLKNRIVMAPMTRSRAINNIPNDIMKTYYSQRSGAGLIITEGTSPSINGLGYPRIPAAYTDEQIEGWKSVFEGIHKNNGKVFVQLMHTGRVTAHINLPEGGEVLAPSPVFLEGEIYSDTGMQPHNMPREMTLEDIANAQNEFVDASKRLIEAGADGIELHSANGYLLNQFLNPKTNTRTDNYGGSFENRARFVLETASKVATAIGGNKVGIRFSPYSVFNDLQGEYDDLVPMFTYLATELAKLNFIYIHIVDQRVAMSAPEFATDISKTIKEAFKGAIIVGGDVHTTKQGEALLNKGYDLVYIGRPFISNPNLVKKLKANKALTPTDYDKLYTADKAGYIDYL